MRMPVLAYAHTFVQSCTFDSTAAGASAGANAHVQHPSEAIWAQVDIGTFGGMGRPEAEDY
eukprot:8207842-Lingulodinium_polyedra.AAC.1